MKKIEKRKTGEHGGREVLSRLHVREVRGSNPAAATIFFSIPVKLWRILRGSHILQFPLSFGEGSIALSQNGWMDASTSISRA